MTLSYSSCAILGRVQGHVHWRGTLCLHVQALIGPLVFPAPRGAWRAQSRWLLQREMQYCHVNTSPVHRQSVQWFSCTHLVLSGVSDGPRPMVDSLPNGLGLRRLEHKNPWTSGGFPGESTRPPDRCPVIKSAQTHTCLSQS